MSIVTSSSGTPDAPAEVADESIGLRWRGFGSRCRSRKGSRSSEFSARSRRCRRLAIAVDDYRMKGVGTHTDLLAAIAGDVPKFESEDPSILEREVSAVRPKSAAFTPWPASRCRAPVEFPSPAIGSNTRAGASRWSTWTGAGSTSSSSPGTEEREQSSPSALRAARRVASDGYQLRVIRLH